MKFIFSFILVCHFIQYSSGQSKVYNQFLVATEEVTVGGYQSKLGVKLLQQMYKIKGENVVELYEMGGDKWYGFAGDTSKFDIKRLPFYKKDGIKKLVKKYPFPIATAIYQKDVIAGMNAEQMELAKGKAETVVKESNNDIYTYSDKTRITLQNGIITKIERP